MVKKKKKKREKSSHRVSDFSRKITILFKEVNSKPMCLESLQQVSMLKENNTRHHNNLSMVKKYNHLDGELRKQKIKEMLISLKK